MNTKTKKIFSAYNKQLVSTNVTHTMNNTETATPVDDCGDVTLEVTARSRFTDRTGLRFGVCTSFVALSLHLLLKLPTMPMTSA